jgi:hypothetical protein
MSGLVFSIGVASLWISPGCGDVEADRAGTSGAGGTAGAGGSSGLCNAVEKDYPDEGHDHVLACSPVSYGTTPPSSGNHYPVWAAYKTYSSPIPPGFFVHNLEHGGIALFHDCGGDCSAELSSLASWEQGLPADSTCSAVPHRVIVAPFPNLGHRFALVAWTHILTMDCVDTSAMDNFYRAYYGKGLESMACGNGVDLEAPGSVPAPDCGLGSGATP